MTVNVTYPIIHLYASIANTVNFKYTELPYTETI